MTRSGTIRILIVDDHEVVRHGLRSLLALESDFRIAGEAGCIADAIAEAERLNPHVILLDAKLPDASGMEGCRELLNVAPAARILVLTSYAEVATVAAAVRYGAHGYALKDVRTDDLVRAIREIAEGRGYLDPRMIQRALHRIRAQFDQATAKTQGAALSPQERRIIPLLAEGKTNKEIAAYLKLSDKTVRNYLAKIFGKLKVRRRTEAVAWFLRESQSSYSSHNQ
jgi:DNA-binding NarL/FixJ family response regulator